MKIDKTKCDYCGKEKGNDTLYIFYGKLYIYDWEYNTRKIESYDVGECNLIGFKTPTLKPPKELDFCSNECLVKYVEEVLKPEIRKRLEPVPSSHVIE